MHAFPFSKVIELLSSSVSSGRVSGGTSSSASVDNSDGGSSLCDSSSDSEDLDIHPTAKVPSPVPHDTKLGYFQGCGHVVPCMCEACMPPTTVGSYSDVIRWYPCHACNGRMRPLQRLFCNRLDNMCPICYSAICDAVFIKCGHAVCHRCGEKCVCASGFNCPQCRQVSKTVSRLHDSLAGGEANE